jgi:hypothetical protein
VARKNCLRVLFLKKRVKYARYTKCGLGAVWLSFGTAILDFRHFDRPEESIKAILETNKNQHLSWF